MKITLDEATEQLREAENHFRGLEAKLNEEIVGVPTAERVLAEVEARAAVEEAARQLLDAQATYIEVKQVTTEQRQERARAELDAVETELVAAVDQAELAITDLEMRLRRVLDLSKKRYSFRQEADGRAPRSLLARSGVSGWLLWRLSGLELPELDTAPHHYRMPLAQLLGLDSETSHESDTTDGGDS